MPYLIRLSFLSLALALASCADGAGEGTPCGEQTCTNSQVCCPACNVCVNRGGTLCSVACGAADGGREMDGGRRDGGRFDAGGGSEDAGRMDAQALDAPVLPDAGRFDAGCGILGSHCCSGDVCTEGRCLAGRCTVFGGVYAELTLDHPDLPGRIGDCNLANPLSPTADCSCPDGFVAERLEDADFYADEGAGTANGFFICRLEEDTPGADFRGAYGELVDTAPFTGCPAAECSTDNEFGTGCGCPSGSEPLILRGYHAIDGASTECGREFGFCIDTSAGPRSFGGIYHEDTRDGCLVENPFTDDCTCPAPFAAHAFEMIAFYGSWHDDAFVNICF